MVELFKESIWLGLGFLFMTGLFFSVLWATNLSIAQRWLKQLPEEDASRIYKNHSGAQFISKTSKSEVQLLLPFFAMREEFIFRLIPGMIILQLSYGTWSQDIELIEKITVVVPLFLLIGGLAQILFSLAHGSMELIRVQGVMGGLLMIYFMLVFFVIGIYAQDTLLQLVISFLSCSFLHWLWNVIDF